MTVSIGTREYRIPYSRTNPNQMGPDTINHQRHGAERHLWHLSLSRYQICTLLKWLGLREPAKPRGKEQHWAPTGLQNLVCSVPLVSVRSVRSRGVFNPGTTPFGRPACSKNDGFVIEGNLGDSSCKKWRWLVEQRLGAVSLSIEVQFKG